MSWIQLADGVAPAQASEINTISMVVLLAVMVGMGWFCDRVGRKPVLLGATAIAFVGALPLFWLIHHPDPALILLGQMGFVVSVGMFLVPRAGSGDSVSAGESELPRSGEIDPQASRTFGRGSRGHVVVSCRITC